MVRFWFVHLHVVLLLALAAPGFPIAKVHRQKVSNTSPEVLSSNETQRRVTAVGSLPFIFHSYNTSPVSFKLLPRFLLTYLSTGKPNMTRRRVTRLVVICFPLTLLPPTSTVPYIHPLINLKICWPRNKPDVRAKYEYESHTFARQSSTL